MLRPTHGPWKKEFGILNFKIGDKNLNLISIKSKKGTQRRVLLEVGLEDLSAGRLKFRLMHDLYIYFPVRNKISLSQIILLMLNASSLTFDDLGLARI